MAALLGFDEVLVAGDVVTAAEQTELAAWADDQRDRQRLLQNPVDALSRSTPYLRADGQRTPLTECPQRAGVGSAPVWVPESSPHAPDTLPASFWTIRTRVVDLQGLHHLQDDPYKGSFLTSVAPGGDVHTHKDSRLSHDGRECPLLRCNVVVQRPEAGGAPVIQGTEIAIPDLGMWMFYATENVHGATRVGGSTNRVTLSFGFIIDPDDVWARPVRPRPGLEQALLDGLRSQLREQSMDSGRTAILDCLLSRSTPFTVSDVATEQACDPWSVWREVRRLRRAGLVESQATPPPHGSVVVV